jgi:hypothetical protein
MKTSRPIAAFVAACSALGLSLQAAPITYEFSNNPAFQSGEYAIRGSITTDGTLGLLSDQNYTNAEFTISQGSTVLVDGPAQVYFPFNVIATEDAILLPPPERSMFGQPALFYIYMPTGSSFASLEWNRFTGGYMEDRMSNSIFEMYPPQDYVYGVTEATLRWANNVTGAIPTDVNGNWIVASAVASSIPEPSTYGLVVGGLILGGATVRRRNRQQG